LLKFLPFHEQSYHRNGVGGRNVLTRFFVALVVCVAEQRR